MLLQFNYFFFFFSKIKEIFDDLRMTQKVCETLGFTLFSPKDKEKNFKC